MIDMYDANPHRNRMIANAVARLNASRADLPGLWNAPGYPELTTAQVVAAAMQLPPAWGADNHE